MSRAVALLAPYFGCAFDTCNVDPDLNDFFDLRGDIYDAVRVNLESVEFDEPEDESDCDESESKVANNAEVAEVQTLPFASGAAWFELPAGIERSVEEVKAWQEANSYLDCGLRFFWRIPGETPRDSPREYDLSDVLRLWVEFGAEDELEEEESVDIKIRDENRDEVDACSELKNDLENYGDERTA